MVTGAVLAFAFIVGLSLFGGDSGTTVVLMPDESGQIGAVTVSTADDSRVLDQAYNAVTAKEDTTRLGETQALTEAQVNKEYEKVLKAQPPKPSSFILYFVVGSSELTAESRAIVPQIVDRINAQVATEVRIIGHTDTTGSDEINDRLALERARVVEKLLKSSIPSFDRVSVNSYGSKDPLVPTAPNVDEPRNRRVEILIL